MRSTRSTRAGSTFAGRYTLAFRYRSSSATTGAWSENRSA